MKISLNEKLEIHLISLITTYLKFKYKKNNAKRSTMKINRTNSLLITVVNEAFFCNSKFYSLCIYVTCICCIEITASNLPCAVLDFDKLDFDLKKKTRQKSQG